MRLDITTDWDKIRAYVAKAMDASYHVALATVSPDGEPSVMPIGSLVLNADPTRFFMERFPRRLAENAAANPRICLLAENTSLRALVKAARRPDAFFGVKLYGDLGDVRPATPDDVRRIKARLPLGKTTAIQRALLSGPVTVRDLTFTGAEALAVAVDRAAHTMTVL